MNAIEMEKLKKLKNMKRLATGLLIFMAVTYVSLKRFEESSFIISCIVAFSEASMIGALADWFAVVALFRHPMGFKWIPHTAIIQRNQERIGDSLASFVVENFFTEEVLRNKLINIHLTDNLLKYLRENKNQISNQTVKFLPGIIEYVVKDGKLTESIKNSIISLIKRTEVTPYFERIVISAFSSKLHVPIIKQIINGIYNYVDNNKEETLKILEGINKAFALPIVGDIVYSKVVKMLYEIQSDIENEIPTPIVNELLTNLPDKIIEKIQSSERLREIVENKKDEFIDSELFSVFITEKLDNIVNEMLAYSIDSKEKLAEKIVGYIDSIIEDIQSNAGVNNGIEIWVQNTVIRIIEEYRDEMGKIISDTVKEWPMDDMVQKLEIQVGGDLQYIRINGTVIGGLAGLGIHLLSYLASNF